MSRNWRMKRSVILEMRLREWKKNSHKRLRFWRLSSSSSMTRITTLRTCRNLLMLLNQISRQRKDSLRSRLFDSWDLNFWNRMRTWNYQMELITRLWTLKWTTSDRTRSWLTKKLSMLTMHQRVHQSSRLQQTNIHSTNISSLNLRRKRWRSLSAQRSYQIRRRRWGTKRIASMTRAPSTLRTKVDVLRTKLSMSSSLPLTLDREGRRSKLRPLPSSFRTNREASTPNIQLPNPRCRLMKPSWTRRLKNKLGERRERLRSSTINPWRSRKTTIISAEDRSPKLRWSILMRTTQTTLLTWRWPIWNRREMQRSSRNNWKKRPQHITRMPTASRSSLGASHRLLITQRQSQMSLNLKERVKTQWRTHLE